MHLQFKFEIHQYQWNRYFNVTCKRHISYSMHCTNPCSIVSSFNINKSWLTDSAKTRWTNFLYYAFNRKAQLILWVYSTQKEGKEWCILDTFFIWWLLCIKRERASCATHTMGMAQLISLVYIMHKRKVNRIDIILWIYIYLPWLSYICTYNICYLK